MQQKLLMLTEQEILQVEEVPLQQIVKIPEIQEILLQLKKQQEEHIEALLRQQEVQGQVLGVRLQEVVQEVIARVEVVGQPEEVDLVVQ